MQQGQLLNLQRLERQYMQALSQNGWESPIVVNTAVDFANTLIRDGRTLLKLGNQTQAEMYFNRAKEITTPISITSGIFYTNTFVKSRGHAILQISQLHEQQHQYQKAWMNIRDVLPFMEKFSYTKRVNIVDDDQQVLKLYVQLLFHGIENCRMMRRKEDMLDQCNKLVEILQRLGITFDSLRKLTKEEFHTEYKKWFTMLSRAFYHIGKSQFKVGFEREALRNLYKAWQISELVYGPDQPPTIKSRDKYEKLSQKMEFEMIMGSDKVDFQQFKAELQKDVGQELLKKNIILKPNKNFNHHILQQVKSYSQIVSQLSSHSSKYQLPEYVKKVRQEYEEKLRVVSDIKLLSEEQLKYSKYQIKNKKLSSRAASTYMNQSILPQDRLFSPRLSIAAQSQRVSHQPSYQNLIENHMDELKESLYKTEFRKQSVNEMLLSRPQLKSQYIKQKKSEPKGESVETIQLNKKKFKSSRIIPRALARQQTIAQNKTETQQSEQRLLKGQTIPDSQMEDQKLPTEESQIPLTSPVQNLPIIMTKSEDTETNENPYADYLLNHTLEQLNYAAQIIQQYYRQYCKLKQSEIQNVSVIAATPMNLNAKPLSLTQFSEKQVDSIQSARNSNSMKMSVKDNLKSSLRRGRAFDQIVKEITKPESEQSSSNKAKTLVSIIVEFYNLPEQEFTFLAKLFFDREPKVWTLSQISLRAFSEESYQFHTEEDEAGIVDSSPREIKHQLQHIMNIFTSKQSIKGLQLIVFFKLQNDKQKYTLNFKIANFISYLDEYQRWFSKDRLENFEGLLSIYCKQQNLNQPTFDNTFYFTKKTDYSTRLISKLMYVLKYHYYIIKSIVGFKVITMKNVIDNELQNEIINIGIIQYNYNLDKQKKRLMLLKQLKIEPIKLIQQQQQQQYSLTYQSVRHKNISGEFELQQEQSILLDEDSEDEYQINQQQSISQKSQIPDKSQKSLESQSEQKQFTSKNYKSVENAEYEQPESTPTNKAMRKIQKQYSVISNRQNLVSPRIEPIAVSQHVIKSANPTPKAQNSRFSILKKQVEKDTSPVESHEQEIQWLEQYFPEFKMADPDLYLDYQPQEGPEIQFKELLPKEYFLPRGIILEPEEIEYENELPDIHILLSFVSKTQENKLITGYISKNDDKIYMIIDQENGQIIQKEINFKIGQRLLTKQQKIDIINLLNEKEVEQKTSQSIIEQLMSQINQRHILILLDRYVKRINHYDEIIRQDAFLPLITNKIIQPTQLTIVNYQEKMVQLNISYDLTNPLDEIITENLSIEKGELQSNDLLCSPGKMYETYNSSFDIQANKLYVKTSKWQLKVEISFKETKTFDTKLLYLNDQQAKQDQQVLRKQMHELIAKSKVLLKFRIYFQQLGIYSQQNIMQTENIEKILHIFRKPNLIKYQIQAQAKQEQKIIGKNLELRRYQISLEERNRDKFSELDNFLLKYIQDPTQFIVNENQRLLKQTLLFYYFKQQLKLTLISSSRQRYFIKTYFLRKTFNMQSRVSNIGKVFVECEVYQFNKFYMDQSEQTNTYFYIQITPQESRTKLFKLILDLADVQSLYNKITAENCTFDYVLFEIVKLLTAYLVYYRTNTYHGIKIPLSYISSESKYDLHNTFKEVTYGSNLLEDQDLNHQTIQKQNLLQSDPILRKKSQPSIFNEIDNLQLPEEANKILKNTTMFTPVFRGQKFIYKTTKVVNSMYVIITVSYLSLGYFQIGLYIPQTCRNFNCYIKQCDFRNMREEFLESIFPSMLVNKETIDQFYVNRWKFNEINKIYLMATNHPEEFEDFYSEMRSQARAIPQMELQKLTESKVSINIDDDGLEKLESPKLESFSDQSRQNMRSYTQPPQFLKKIIKQNSVQSQLGSQQQQQNRNSLQINSLKADKSLFYKHSPRLSECGENLNYYQLDKDLFFTQILVRKNNLDMISTFEMKIWEQLINKMNITHNDQERFIFNLDTFKGVLRETLYTEVVYLGNEVNALFEVFVENIRKPVDIFGGQSQIRLSQSQNYQLYQRITLFESLKVVNFKILLRKVLYSYHNDEKRNLQNLKLKDSNVDQYEFIQSDQQKCAVYMLNKLKKQFKIDSSKFIVQDVIGDIKCPQLIKVNASYQQYAQLKQFQYKLLIRNIFTMKPKIIYVSIFYKKKIFYLFFENMINCKNMILKLSLFQVLESIPFALSLMDLGLLQELGQRIHRGFKNQLLISIQQLI